MLFPPVASICADADDTIYTQSRSSTNPHQHIRLKHEEKKEGTHVPELVRHTWERSSERRRTQLRQLNRDNTPSALYTKLHAESASGETREAARKDPEGDEGADEEGECDDGETTAHVLGDVASNGTTTSKVQSVIKIRKSGMRGKAWTHAMAPQFPMMVATVASWVEKPFVFSMYVG